MLHSQYAVDGTVKHSLAPIDLIIAGYDSPHEAMNGSKSLNLGSIVTEHGHEFQLCTINCKPVVRSWWDWLRGVPDDQWQLTYSYESVEEIERHKKLREEAEFVASGGVA